MIAYPPGEDRTTATWGHPDRTIGVRLDRIVRPLARPLSFFGADFVRTPAMPELRFQPIAILLVAIAFVVALGAVPAKYLASVIAFVGYPTIWTAAITARFARAAPAPDERERGIRRKARKTALIVSLCACVGVLGAVLLAPEYGIEPRAGSRDLRPVIWVFGVPALLPAIFAATRLLVIGWSAPRIED